MEVFDTKQQQLYMNPQQTSQLLRMGNVLGKCHTVSGILASRRVNQLWNLHSTI